MNGGSLHFECRRFSLRKLQGTEKMSEGTGSLMVGVEVESQKGNVMEEGSSGQVPCFYTAGSGLDSRGFIYVKSKARGLESPLTRQLRVTQ